MADTQHPHIFSESGLQSLIAQQRTGQINLEQFTGVPVQWHMANYHSNAHQHVAGGSATYPAIYSQSQGSSSTLQSNSWVAGEHDSDSDTPLAREISKLESFSTNKRHRKEMSTFSAFSPQFAKVMPFVMYIAIAGALTFSSVTEWLQTDSITSSLQLEEVATWALTTMITLHSESSYPPIEQGM
jgi:hypothetical protein